MKGPEGYMGDADSTHDSILNHLSFIMVYIIFNILVVSLNVA